MRTLVLLLGVLAVMGLALPAMADTTPVNGYLHEVNGQRVLHVWGTHYEMGYAHGVLLGKEIVQSMNEYVLNLLPPAIYSAAHIIAPLLFQLPDEYREEVRGMIDGVFASGANAFITPLNRYLDADDLIFCNAVGDIGAMACSSQIVWDSATKDDPQLHGETALVRNLDWALAGPNRFLLPESTIVIVYTPTENDEQTVATVSFPGFFGCLSCMNEAGVAAAVNIAHNGIPLWDISFTRRYYHIGVTLRQALHARDLNGDGAFDLHDVLDHIADQRSSGAIAINIAEPRDLALDEPGVVAETDADGFAARTPADDPEFFGDILIATNHLRKLRAPIECDRYAKMHEIITNHGGKLTMDLMWWIEGQVIQNRRLSTTAQTMYFIPFRREMGVAYSSDDAFSPDKQPALLTWDDVTELPAGVDLSDDDTSPTPDESGSSDDDNSHDRSFCG